MNCRVVLVFLFAAATARADAEPAPLLARLKAVKAEGDGNADAAQAWRALVALGPKALVPTLQALDGADPAAANWLRSAADAVAERALAAKQPLPVDALETHVKETQRAPAGRRLAYELLTRIDKNTPDRLLPGLLQDPSVELRRDAVAAVLADAKALLAKEDKDGARKTYQKALSGARDRDQVDLCAKELKALGVTVDVTAHFGYVLAWHVVGPFDSRGGKGFAEAFPPEAKIDLGASFKGKDGAALAWKPTTSADPYGIVDLNKALGKNMGAAAYAHAVVESPTARDVELRAASNNAVKIFLNGRLLYAKEEYHHGIFMDQHIGRGTLKAGRNDILVKVCQNEQKDEWAQTWQLQLRVCDAVGGAVPLTQAPKAAR